MPIFKLQQKSNYVTVPNATARDKRLSLEARGALTYLLTNSDTFELSFEFLQKELGVGRDKMNKIARELKQNGYLELRAAHNRKGKFSGQEWFIYAESQNVDFSLTTNSRPTEKPEDVKTGRRENRKTENTEDILKEKLRQKQSIKELKEKEESLSPRAAAREILASEIFDEEPKGKPKGKPKSELLPEEYSPTLAIKIFREIYPTTYLDGEKLKDFAARLPEVEESVWRQNLLDWKLSGWQSSNISGLIKRYHKELKDWQTEQVKKQNGGSNGNAIIQTGQSGFETANQRRDREARERIRAGNSADELLRRHGII